MIVRVGSSIACLSLVVACASGCRRHANPIIGRAEASSAQRSGKAAQLAAARALIGDEDDEGGGPGNGARANGRGTARWRDTVVYVDGKPLGVLRFGELPIALKPTWIDEKAPAEIEPGTHGPGYTIRKARRYRFVDLLRALGVDLNKVNQLHVQGPKLSQVLIATGAELRSKKGSELMFRFGSITGGKALPVIPGEFGNRQHFDKISSVMVYIDKKPPTLVPNEGLALDGQELEGVAYYGEPMRGGIRVYADDKLALQIKKRVLDELEPASRAGGLARYNLFAVLAHAGVDTSQLVEGWVIANEHRGVRLSRAELLQLEVAMGDKHKNELTIGDRKLDGESIALHSHALAAADLPQLGPDEE
jgi:hypothetical protein